MNTTYMTGKLSLTDGTIVYPQASMDNIVASISDPTLVTLAKLTGGTVAISNLPVVTTIESTSTDLTVPTAKAVYTYVDLHAGSGTVTGIAANISGGTATVTVNGGTGAVKFVGAGAASVSQGQNGEIVISATSGGGGGGGGDYAESAGYASSAGSLTSGTFVNGATVTFTNIPQSAVTDLTTALAGKQPVISSGATMDINITGNAASATSAGHATSAGTAGGLATGVVVASATNATSAISADSATSAGTAGAVTAAVSSAIISAAVDSAGGGGGGSGTVTGIAAEVSGNTATINATGSTTSVDIVGRDGTNVTGNTDSSIELDVAQLSGRAVFNNSADSLSANTELIAVQNCNNMKNDCITFFCNFESFGTLEIGHCGDVSNKPGSFLRITSTTIERCAYDGSTIGGAASHGLSLSSFIFVTIQELNDGDVKAKITITTAMGSFEVTNKVYGSYGPVFARASMNVTNAFLNYVVPDAHYPVWVFGDSYIDLNFATASWAYQFIRAGHSNTAFIGVGGETAQSAKLSFDSLIEVAQPRYVVWALGMNNKDSGAINSGWKDTTDAVVAACQARGIVPILCVLPSTPLINNTYKNAYIRSSGLRYVNFARAVNAESAGATWYSGMLKSDQVHPTALGASALMNEFVNAVPESVLGDGSTISNGDSSMTGGFRISLSGSTINYDRYIPVENVTGSSVTMLAEHAYRINATASAVTLNTEDIPVGRYGRGFVQIYLTETNNIVPGSNVSIASTLQANAVNNCSVRFSNGYATLTLEDTSADYIVMNNASSGFGSLAYGLSTAPGVLLPVDASVNGQTLSLAGAVTSAGEKHLVGNGYTQTIVSGGIQCTSNTRFTSLGMADTVVSAGTGVLLLDDVRLVSGATVTVSGGSLGITKVEGNESIIDLGGTTRIEVDSWSNITATGVTFSGGSVTGYGGGLAIQRGATGLFSSCSFINNSATSYGGALYVNSSNVDFYDCIFSGNSALNYGFAIMNFAETVKIVDCTFGPGQSVTNIGTGSIIIVAGSCAVLGTLAKNGSSGELLISAGTVINCTGNTNNTVILQSSGGCKVGSGDSDSWVVGGTATFINQGGSSIVLEGTFTQVTRTGVIS